MPSMPKIRNGNCEKRTLKVFIQCNTEQFRCSKHHIDPTGKICIQLDRITKDCYHDSDSHIVCIILKDLIDDHTGTVRQYQLFKIPPQDPLRSESDPFHRKRMRPVQLFSQAIVPTDRTLQKLWEKGYKQCKTKYIFLCFAFSPVYIQQISH